MIEQALTPAAVRLNVARKAVIDWMDAEGREGRLRTNSEAPGWAEYEAAEAALRQAVFDAGNGR